MAFHPCGDYVATASFDKTWRLWSVETGEELLCQEGHSRPVYDLSFHPDGGSVRHRGPRSTRQGLGPSLGQVRDDAGGTRQAVPLRGLLPQRVPHRDGLGRSHREDMGSAQARVFVHRPRSFLADIERAIRTQGWGSSRRHPTTAPRSCTRRGTLAGSTPCGGTRPG